MSLTRKYLTEPYCLSVDDVLMFEKITRQKIKYNKKTSFSGNILYYFKSGYHIFSPDRMLKMNNSLVFLGCSNLNGEIIYIEDLSLSQIITLIDYYESMLDKMHRVFSYNIDNFVKKAAHDEYLAYLKKRATNKSSDQIKSFDYFCDQSDIKFKDLTRINKKIVKSNVFEALPLIFSLRDHSLDKLSKSLQYKPSHRKFFRTPIYFEKFNLIFDRLEEIINDKKEI